MYMWDGNESRKKYWNKTTKIILSILSFNNNNNNNGNSPIDAESMELIFVQYDLCFIDFFLYIN